MNPALSFLPTSGSCLAIAALLLCYLLLLVFSRLFWSPLVAFPGPRFAAVTSVYQAYYDYWKDGDFVYQLHKLHQKYGPVVRIGPNELHFDSVDAYRDIYQIPSTFLNKESFFIANQLYSSFVTRDATLHRKHRDYLGPMYSRRAVLKVEGHIQFKANLLTQKLLSYQAVDLRKAFLSFALDTTWSYVYGEHDDTLSFPDFNHPVVATLSKGHLANQIAMSCPNLLKLLPTFIRRMILQEGHIRMMDILKHNIDESRNKVGRLAKSADRKVPDHLSGADSRSKAPLGHQSLNWTIAGAGAIANACVVGFFYVHHNPKILARLREELQLNWPDPQATVSYETLEKLPYLTAVIKESLRLSHGVPVGLRRVVKPSPAKIIEFLVPEGTIVSVSTTFMHWNKHVFSNPLNFSPDRWLDDHETLDPHLVPFSRGPRQCMGINLSWCELYFLFGSIFRRVDLELDEDMTLEDIQDVRCHFIPIVGRRKPLHAVVKGKRSSESR